MPLVLSILPSVETLWFGYLLAWAAVLVAASMLLAVVGFGIFESSPEVETLDLDEVL